MMHIAPQSRRRHPRCGRSGFTLVELLTVVFIIGALIAILVPSISAARNQAKTVATKSAIKAIEVGLEMFKADNARDFPQTNGYPPSFAHPIMTAGNFAVRNSVDGQFPFINGRPKVSGAHWLPAMLMGVDQQGYLSRKTVPKLERSKVETWYTADGPSGGGPLERVALYLDPGNVRTVRTRDIRGRGNPNLYDDSSESLGELPVIVDMFDQPLLYYAANTHGRGSNMLEDERVENNSYTGAAGQGQGPPYYFHQDNVMFTGNENNAGWNFGGASKGHPIAYSGESLTANQLKMVVTGSGENNNRTSFATYICDRKLLKSFTDQSSTKTKLRPVKSDSFLLFSAGVDGRYGTGDDPKNFPDFQD